MKFIRIKTTEFHGFTKFAVRLDIIVKIEFSETATVLHLAGQESISVSIPDGERICKLLQIESLEGPEA